MSDRLSEIEERLAATTPGPWGVEEKFSLTSIRMQDPTARLGFRLVAQVPRRTVGENTDAELIAHAPADLAALVALVKAVREVADDAARPGIHRATIERRLRAALSTLDAS